jgi:hypothetical protein
VRVIDGASEIAILAANPPTAPLLILSGQPPASLEAARSLASAWCPTTFAYDVVDVAPAGRRWGVDEISNIVDLTCRVPVGACGVVIVQRADDLTAAAADRLLLPVERADFAWTFLLLAESPDRLPATLRGRAGAVVRVAAASAHVDALEGASTQVRAVLAGSSTMVEVLDVAPAGGERLVQVLSTPLGGSTPSTTALAVHDAVAAAVDDLGVPPADRPALRRETARLLLDVWALSLRNLMPLDPSMNPADVAAVERQIVASQQLLELNGDVLTAVAAVLAVAHVGAVADGIGQGRSSGSDGLPPATHEPW